MKLGIISSRANSARVERGGVFEDEAYMAACFEKAILSFAKEGDTITIISGGGRGPETFAKKFAEENDHQFTVIPPRSKARGAMAFPERNTAITSVSDVLLVFWGGEDMYIASALSEAMFVQKPVMVFPI